LRKNINTFYFLLAMIVLNSMSVSAQVNSIFSDYGIGRMNSPVVSSNRLSGELSAAYNNYTNINNQNPASYTSANYTLIDVGLKGDNMNASYRDSSYGSSGFGISYVNLLFPIIQNKAGLSLGFQENSTVNYSSKGITTDSYFGKQKQTYTGSGGTYKVYGGSAYKWGNFSAGFNVGLLFGTIKKSNSLLYTDTAYLQNVQSYKNLSISNLYYDLGIQYSHEINKKNALSFGAFFHNEFSASNNIKYKRYSIDPVYNVYETIEDTSYTTSPFRSYIVGAGVSYTTNKCLTLGLEYNYTNIYQNLGEATTNSWHAKFGMEYRPFNNTNIDARKFLNRITYRMGTVIGKSEYPISGSLNEFKIMGGMSIPVWSRSLSLVTVGLQYHQTGFSSTEYSEGITSLFIQLTFGDRWFVRPKFD